MISAKAIHRSFALLLGLFVISHLGVHLTAILGPQSHLAALNTVQVIYRNPFGEILLVVAILTQVITGARRLRFKEIEGWALLQVMSGCYLLTFLLLHTSAALYTHHLLRLETDFYWAAGSLHFSPIKYGFAVYYFAAVLAFFVHISAAIHFGWPQAPRSLTTGLPIFGAIISGLIVSAFWGAFYPIEITPEVAAYYEQNFGALGLKGD
ncbi:MAG: hypothetical protein VR74_09730 [Hyphomonas sp. BRH_c22]|uniref:hypothetical protein n=1 Tax=Hyphomonas sp. BRH_c22 TaxID=1629710 RepID=UPI0005F23B86|nr:hypothetical protein [Hyphomonas sp. BRH_c22]KJS37213.1 MAG: hypothetical protein VR74_09730 [Hyphomonas sp. BRH_c22]